MKITEARAEAKRRWGLTGFAKIRRSGFPDKYVGYAGTRTDVVMGWSNAGNNRVATWEEAFEKADKKKVKP